MLEELKQRVLEQNIALVKHGLVVLTWGNVSAKDAQSGLVVIKPSGVSYDVMRAEDMVVVDLAGNVIEGEYNPSSDLPTHLYLYNEFPALGGIVHTHSTYATAFAQAGLAIPALGTTHADAFYGAIPCSRSLTPAEIADQYEHNTGKVIAETVATCVEEIPGVLVKNHGVFTWGKTAEKAVENAVTLEEVAKMASITLALNPTAPAVEQELLDKHYWRKHGASAYYGQKK